MKKCSHDNIGQYACNDNGEVYCGQCDTSISVEVLLVTAMQGLLESKREALDRQKKLLSILEFISGDDLMMKKLKQTIVASRNLKTHVLHTEPNRTGESTS